MGRLSAWLEDFLLAGLDPEVDQELRWRVRTVNGGGLIYFLVQIFWVFNASFFFRVPLVGFLFLVLSVPTAVLLWVLRRRPEAVRPIGHAVVANIFVGVLVPNYLTGGAGGANLATILCLAPAAILLVGWQSIPWLVISGGAAVGMYVASARGWEFPNMVAPEERHADAVFTIVIAWTTLSAIFLYYERVRRRIAGEARRQRQAALDAAEVKSAFLANMTHEIRTPLGGVLGMNRLLGETELDAEQREYVATLGACATTLLELVDDVLDLSKIEAGKLDLELATFALGEAVEEVCTAMALRAHEKHLELVCDLDPAVPALVVGDRMRFKQILLNLVSNAVKFTTSGEVVLSVERDGPSRVYFQVSDTGIGVSDDARSSIFEAFTQGDPSTTRRYGGTGLGLRIASELVEMMDGEIGLDDTASGATFWFVLPLEPAESAPPASPDLNACRVLILDDSRAAGQSVARTLESRGVEVEVAADLADALSRLRGAEAEGEAIEVCLVDEQMESDQGETAVQYLRRSLSKPPKVVALSPAGGRRLSGRWWAGEVDGSVTKPVRRAELVETINGVIAGRPRSSASSGLADSAEPPTAPLAEGRRVLIVEDEPVSRTTLTLTLKKRGLEVIETASGRESIELLGREEVDLVLMDVQMPEMDGLEATRLIRDGSSAVRQHEVPIVAVTANAFPESRQACFEAGMDDFLTKPVRPRELGRVLTTYLGVRKPVPDADADEGDSTVFDPSVLLGNLGGEPAYAREVLDLWLGDAPKRIEALAQAAAAGDAAEVQAAAHTLKGGAANVGAERFRQLAERIDFAAREADLGPAHELLDQLRPELEAVEAAGGQAFASESGRP